MRDEGTPKRRQCRDIKVVPTFGGPLGKSAIIFLKSERLMQIPHSPEMTTVEVSLDEAKQLRERLDWVIQKLEHPEYAEEGGGK